MQLRGDVFAHNASHLVVVGTDKGRVFLRIGFPLKHDDRDTLVVGTVDGWGNGLHLIRSHDEQVDARCHQTINLLHLPFVTIVGSSKPQLHITLQVCSHA